MPSRTPPFRFAWASWFGFWTLDNTVSENSIGVNLKAFNGASEVSDFASSFDIAGGNNVTITKISDGISISAEDTQLSSGELLLNTPGTLTLDVEDTKGNTVGNSITGLGFTLNDGKYVLLNKEVNSGTASVGSVYSKDEIDAMIKGIDGMTYKGAIVYGGTLPVANVRIGDTYSAAASGLTASGLGGSFNDSTFSTSIGDLFIATAKDGVSENVSTGYLPADGIEWTYIPAGNDSLDAVTYTAEANSTNKSILLQNANNQEIMQIKMAEGTDISISALVGQSSDSGYENNSIAYTINHATYNAPAPTLNSNLSVNQTGSTFTAVAGITTNNGHITGIETASFKERDWELDQVVSVATENGLNTATIATELSTGGTTYSNLNVKVKSDTLKITEPTENNIQVELLWGTF